MSHSRWTSISTGMSSSYVNRCLWAEFRAKLTSELASDVIPARPARILLSYQHTRHELCKVLVDSLVEQEDLLSTSTHPGLSALTAHSFTSRCQRQIEQLSSHFLRSVSVATWTCFQYDGCDQPSPRPKLYPLSKLLPGRYRRARWPPWRTRLHSQQPEQTFLKTREILKAGETRLNRPWKSRPADRQLSSHIGQKRNGPSGENIVVRLS